MSTVLTDISSAITPSTTAFSIPPVKLGNQGPGIPGTGELPALRTGGGAEGSNIDPTLRPYLGLGLQRAEQLFFGQPQPSLYPNQMYVSPAQQTIDALAQQEQLARQGSPVLSAGQQSFLRGITEPSAASPLYASLYMRGMQQPGADIYRQAATGQMQNLAMPLTAETAMGGFLQGSPYRQALIEATARPLVQQFGETVLPGIASQFSSAGRYGSGAMERAQSRATEAFGRALGDVATGITAQDYARERAFQESARQQLGALSAQDIATRITGAGGLETAQQAAAARQLAAASGLGGAEEAALERALRGSAAAGAIYGQQFLPSEQLAQIGAAREAIAAKPLQEAISRYQFQQQLPYSQLQSYLSAVYGNPMAGSQMPQQAPAQINRLGSTLGGAAIGAGIGQMTGGSLFGVPAPLVGAGIGGLLGGFF